MLLKGRRNMQKQSSRHQVQTPVCGQGEQVGMLLNLSGGSQIDVLEGIDHFNNYCLGT